MIDFGELVGFLKMVATAWPHPEAPGFIQFAQACFHLLLGHDKENVEKLKGLNILMGNNIILLYLSGDHAEKGLWF